MLKMIINQDNIVSISSHCDASTSRFVTCKREGGGKMSSSSGEICPRFVRSFFRSFVGLNQRLGRVKHEWGEEFQNRQIP